jgi:hypothetical protein
VDEVFQRTDSVSLVDDEEGGPIEKKAGLKAVAVDGRSKSLTMKPEKRLTKLDTDSACIGNVRDRSGAGHIIFVRLWIKDSKPE